MNFFTRRIINLTILSIINCTRLSSHANSFEAIVEAGAEVVEIAVGDSVPKAEIGDTEDSVISLTVVFTSLYRIYSILLRNDVDRQKT